MTLGPGGGWAERNGAQSFEAWPAKLSLLFAAVKGGKNSDVEGKAPMFPWGGGKVVRWPLISCRRPAAWKTFRRRKGKEPAGQAPRQRGKQGVGPKVLHPETRRAEKGYTWAPGYKGSRTAEGVETC